MKGCLYFLKLMLDRVFVRVRTMWMDAQRDGIAIGMMMDFLKRGNTTMLKGRYVRCQLTCTRIEVLPIKKSMERRDRRCKNGMAVDV